ncbi:hypothetical protein Y032_0010g1040 [Ancylostoma ceylanicum]|uniref:Uncharacterized protein n=1 Tax=Ancylostoma ceylanicum TaxID=53326 RepID=A0A016VG19_9BILA|nr:hypothetical protein Y032_0010g1040 [Ancylostoma ceylanicum]
MRRGPRYCQIRGPLRLAIGSRPFADDCDKGAYRLSAVTVAGRIVHRCWQSPSPTTQRKKLHSTWSIALSYGYMFHYAAFARNRTSQLLTFAPLIPLECL